MYLPEETLEILKCHRCPNYLSIFPVKMTKYGNAICWNCGTSLPEARRLIAYETAVKSMMFPCNNKNKGCTMSGPPAEMKIHDGDCDYNMFDCFEECTWKGFLNDFSRHYMVAHVNSLANSGEWFDLKNGKRGVSKLVLQGKDAFLLKLRDNDFDIKCGVYLIYAENYHLGCYTYKINLKVGANTETTFKEGNVEHINNISSGIIFNGINLREANSCEITIINSEKFKEKLSKNDEFYSELFLCKRCNTYMNPPIYECALGHPVCECLADARTKNNTAFKSAQFNKETIIKCPACNSQTFLPIQYYLKNIAACIKYPCVNPGCVTLYSAKEQEKHIQQCIYRKQRCIFKNCAFNDKNYLKHLINAHKNQYHINRLKVKLSHIGLNIIIQRDNVFIEEHSIEDDVLEMHIKPYSPILNYSKFLFEIRMENAVCGDCFYMKTSLPVSLPVKTLEVAGRVLLSEWWLEIAIITN